MALTETQQVIELIKESRSILIVIQENWSGDSVASSLALSRALIKQGKQVKIACQDFKEKINLSFLGLSEIDNTIEGLQKFMISIDTSQTKVGEFYYDNVHDKLNIYLSPKNGQFKPEDVTTSIANYAFDLIFVIGSPDMESLGDILSEHSNFFYSTPKINIDHSNKNENFGNINFVDITSSSIAEIVYKLINIISDNLIDEDIATCLLSGIITSTKNFKTLNVTPRTLDTASALIKFGARRKQIVQNIYQTRFLSTLKLWGRILSRLNNDLDDKLVWSALSKTDFLETATSPEEIIDVIDELIVSMPKTEIIVLIYEKESSIECIVYSVNNTDSLFICKKFNPRGNSEMAKFSIRGASLAEAERGVIEEIKQKLK